VKLLRAIGFWFAVAFSAIALSGIYAELNPDAPTATPIWRQS
jgi:hypothetical protein